MTGRRVLPRNDTYIDGTPVTGRIYQENSAGKLVPVTLVGGSEVIPTGYTITRDASGLWVASASSDGGGGSGIGGGTPGDLSIPLYHGPALVIDAANLISGTSEQPEHKESSRKGHNFTNVGALRLQGVIVQAVSSGKLAFQVSLNSGSVWQFPNAASSGPFVSVAATGYPVIGDWFAVDAGVQVNNIIWRLVCVMPSGVAVPLEHGVIWLDMTSFATPPVTEMPTDPTLPSGSPWGSKILDLLGNNISGVANLARLSSWEDLSASNYDGVPVPTGTGSVRSGGEYHETGFNTIYPYVKIKPSDYGWKVAASGAFQGNETDYYLIDAVTGGGTALNSGDEAANLVSGDEGTNSGTYLRIQGDGRLYWFGGNSIFGGSSGTGTINVADGNRHLIRVIHNASGNIVYVYVDGVLDITINGGVGGNLTYPWTLWRFFGAGNAETHNATLNMHQAVWYNAAHPNTAGYNAVETAILARAGL